MILAVLLVDHGSRRASAHEELMYAGNALAVSLRERGVASVVEIAHMEIAKPTIAEGVERCVDRGATHIRVIPCFLSRGRHVTEDVPALVQQAALDHPQVSIAVSPPLLDLPGFIAMLADHVVNISRSEP